MLDEAVFDQAIRTFMQKFAYQSQPYPSSDDFIQLLYDYSPQELHYFIADQLEKITVYETDIKHVSFTRDDALSYQVEMELEINKFYADPKVRKLKP